MIKTGLQTFLLEQYDASLVESYYINVLGEGLALHCPRLQKAAILLFAISLFDRRLKQKSWNNSEWDVCRNNGPDFAFTQGCSGVQRLAHHYF